MACAKSTGGPFPARHNTHLLGNEGEETARKFLEKRGYHIIESNYRCPVGEIDLIGHDNGVLCFIEVKTRRTHRYGSPLETVTEEKQRRISRVALHYLQTRCLDHTDARFDVVAVCVDHGKLHCELIRNAFEFRA